MAREWQGVGVGLRGLEACGQSVDMAGEGGGRREGVGQCGEVGRGGREKVAVVLSRRGGGESWRESGRAWEWV